MTRISPIILLVIVIIAIAFFALGLIQLLIRYITKRPSFSFDSQSNTFQEPSTYSQAFQSQLQQLFRLHDSGLDRATIDALPVFYYKDIVGSDKDLFDCAVCLCEFAGEDKLKFLPNCTHAFHIQCIETWLLSNSTCPLCRSLIGNTMNSPLSSFHDSTGQWDVSCQEGASGLLSQEMVFSVRLGTFKNSNNGVSSNGGSIDARRCYSMGAFQYVVEDADLQVSLCNGLTGGEKVETQSAIELWNDSNYTETEEKKINPKSKVDSYSVSKIWLWSKNSKFPGFSDDANENVVVLPMPERSDLV